jgi:hypothetical protein
LHCGKYVAWKLPLGVIGSQFFAAWFLFSIFLCFALAVIALGLILLFGLLFVVVIGGTAGWASFTVACIAILLIAAVGIIAIKTH